MWSKYLPKRSKAEELRISGMAIKDIARHLSVSLNTVRMWLKTVSVPKAVIACERKRKLEVLSRARQLNADKCFERRKFAQEEGRIQARKREWLHAAGCMLYWGEGGKTESAVSFSNSDPNMLRMFIRFLKTYYDVAEDKIHLQLHYFTDCGRTEDEMQRFWRSALSVKNVVFDKSILNCRSIRSRGSRKSMTGTCLLRVNSVKLVQELLGAIQEYGSFDNPDWLNTCWSYRQIGKAVDCKSTNAGSSPATTSIVK